jgi:beta-1,4-mannosyl-glycoprotein beta-1,4-N-acetylglucosaminyltransferase
MIYDCFTFFNELDILEIRLNILKNVVDKFVLVEATRTHQGKEKPLYFSDNKTRYKEFADKIIHIVIDEYPPYEGKSAWTLERYQRDMIAKGWKDCKKDDIILVSDVDEIPNPETILAYKDKPGVFVFRQSMYYYFINCLNVSNGSNYKWDGTIMCKFKYHFTPMDLRKIIYIQPGTTIKRFLPRVYSNYLLMRWQLIHLKKIKCVENGGWHFSYLGGVQMIIKKLEAFAHTEYNKDEYKDPEKIEEALKNGKDIFGRDFHYKFVTLDNTFPDFILKNKEKYKHLLIGS